MLDWKLAIGTGVKGSNWEKSFTNHFARSRTKNIRISKDFFSRMVDLLITVIFTIYAHGIAKNRMDHDLLKTSETVRGQECL
jgi:hypothetical protein